MVSRISEELWEQRTTTKGGVAKSVDEMWCGAPALPSIASGHDESEEGNETVQSTPGWVESFEELIRDAATLAQAKQMEIVQRQISILSKRIHDLDAVNSTIVPVLSFAPEPYEPVKEIRVVLEGTEDGFTATLYDANLSMCGETEMEAIEGLKGLIIHVYEVLEKQPKLGPGPRRQLAVLRSLLVKKG